MTYNAGIRAAAALMARYANGNHEDRNRAAAVLGLLREETADDKQILSGYGSRPRISASFAYKLTVGDFRRLRAALTSQGEER